jgi:hypothetical protein
MNIGHKMPNGRLKRMLLTATNGVLEPLLSDLGDVLQGQHPMSSMMMYRSFCMI